MVTGKIVVIGRIDKIEATDKTEEIGTIEAIGRIEVTEEVGTIRMGLKKTSKKILESEYLFILLYDVSY